jgi:hemolysin III
MQATATSLGSSEREAASGLSVALARLARCCDNPPLLNGTPERSERVVMLFASLLPSPEPSAELLHLPGCYEPCSSLSHFFGALLFLGLGLFLLRRGRGDRLRTCLLGVYVASCVFLLLISGSYHTLERGSAARLVVERIDHAAIFVFIAGTCTPAFGVLYRGLWRWVSLLFIWAVAATAITLKTIYFTDLPEWLGLALYLCFGWLGAFSAFHFARRYGFAFVVPLILGGVAYSVGGIMEYLSWPVLVPGMVHPHEVFHVAVLVGALCHWVFVWQFAPGEVRVAWRVVGAPPAPRDVVVAPVPLKKTG